jgi:hypothetical protein
MRKILFLVMAILFYNVTSTWNESSRIPNKNLVTLNIVSSINNLIIKPGGGSGGGGQA